MACLLREIDSVNCKIIGFLLEASPFSLFALYGRSHLEKVHREGIIDNRRCQVEQGQKGRNMHAHGYFSRLGLVVWLLDCLRFSVSLSPVGQNIGGSA